jgi:YVTN family beta-propeller protein
MSQPTCTHSRLRKRTNLALSVLGLCLRFAAIPGRSRSRTISGFAPAGPLGLALLLGLLVLFPVGAWAGGPMAYITNINDNTVSVIDTASNTVTATVPVGNGPNGVAVTPDGAQVYVANVFDDTVSVIDTATNTVTAIVTVGFLPWGVAVTPDGVHVYVANFIQNTVSVIATASNTVAATVPVGANPTGVAVTPDGAHVYVGNQGDGTVSVIATASNTVSATVTVGPNLVWCPRNNW